MTVKTKRKKIGRPPHQPTPERRRTVEALVSYGIRQEDIGNILGIHRETLEKYYRHEIDTAAPKAHARAAETLYQLAIGSDGDIEKGIEPREPNITCLIFYLKCQAKWVERHEISGPSGGPIETKTDLSGLSTADLKQLRMLVTKAKHGTDAGSA